MSISYEADGAGNTIKVTMLPSGTIIREIDGALPVQVVRHITSYAYWNRWPIAKRQAFKQAAKTTIAFEDFIDMVNGAQYVDLDLQSLSDAHVQIVGAAMLAQAESDAILNNPIQAIELP